MEILVDNDSVYYVEVGAKRDKMLLYKYSKYDDSPITIGYFKKDDVINIHSKDLITLYDDMEEVEDYFDVGFYDNDENYLKGNFYIGCCYVTKETYQKILDEFNKK